MANQPAHKNDPLRGKKTGKWTKYGGAIYGLVKEKIIDEWYCQICGKSIPAELPPFNYELFPDEFIRICNICYCNLNNMGGAESIRISRVIKITKIKRD